MRWAEGCFWPWNDFLLYKTSSSVHLKYTELLKSAATIMWNVATFIPDQSVSGFPPPQTRYERWMLLWLCAFKEIPRKEEGNSINIHLPRHVCWRSRTFQGSRNQLDKLVHAPLGLFFLLYYPWYHTLKLSSITLIDIHLMDGPHSMPKNFLSNMEVKHTYGCQ